MSRAFQFLCLFLFQTFAGVMGVLYGDPVLGGIALGQASITGVLALAFWYEDE